MAMTVTGFENMRASNLSNRSVLNVVPQRLRCVLEKYLATSPVEEIRFRVNRPIQVVCGNNDFLLTQYAVFSEREAEEMLKAVCGHSVYAAEKELQMGYVTLDGGARVGVSGKPLFENGRITRLTTISSFNIRIAREALGCAERFVHLFLSNGRPASVIIASPPGIGKTTFLRDLARCLSNGIGTSKEFRVAIADERNELSGSVDGIPTLDVGLRTDIMTLVPKHISIPLLIRSMSPDVVITDELFGAEDMTAVAEATKYGIGVIASIHADSYSQLLSKPWLNSALHGGHFLRMLFLRRSLNRISLIPVEYSKLFEPAN